MVINYLNKNNINIFHNRLCQSVKCYSVMVCNHPIQCSHSIVFYNNIKMTYDLLSLRECQELPSSLVIMLILIIVSDLVDLLYFLPDTK